MRENYNIELISHNGFFLHPFSLISSFAFIFVHETKDQIKKEKVNKKLIIQYKN